MANTLIFFAAKMWVAFAINVFENTLATTVNKFEIVIYELIKLTMF